MIKDNWVARSEGMQCHTCLCYVEKTPNIGRCRRHAPTLQGWPVMFPTDFCFDHKLNEKCIPDTTAKQAKP